MEGGVGMCMCMSMSMCMWHTCHPSNFVMGTTRRARRRRHPQDSSRLGCSCSLPEASYWDLYTEAIRRALKRYLISGNPDIMSCGLGSRHCILKPRNGQTVYC